MIGFGGSVLRTARASINLCPPLRFLRRALKNFCKFYARKTEARSRRSRDFGRSFSEAKFYKADLQKIEKARNFQMRSSQRAAKATRETARGDK